MVKIPDKISQIATAITHPVKTARGIFNGWSVSKAKKENGPSASDTPSVNPSDSKKQLGRFERLDRAVFKLLSKIFNPKLTFKFQSVLKTTFPNKNDQKNYEEAVNELLSHKKPDGFKRSLASDLSQLGSLLDKEQLIFVLLHDPRTQGFFMSKDGLSGQLKSKVKSGQGPEFTQNILTTLVYQVLNEEIDNQGSIAQPDDRVFLPNTKKSFSSKVLDLFSSIPDKFTGLKTRLGAFAIFTKKQEEAGKPTTNLEKDWADLETGENENISSEDTVHDTNANGYPAEWFTPDNNAKTSIAEFESQQFQENQILTPREADALGRSKNANLVPWSDTVGDENYRIYPQPDNSIRMFNATGEEILDFQLHIKDGNGYNAKGVAFEGEPMTQEEVHLREQSFQATNPVNRNGYPAVWFQTGINTDTSWCDALDLDPHSPEHQARSNCRDNNLTPWKDAQGYRIYPQKDKSLKVFNAGGEAVEQFEIDTKGNITSAYMW